jgi:RNA polymerase sigma factor (sigma-70 family)
MNTEFNIVVGVKNAEIQKFAKTATFLHNEYAKALQALALDKNCTNSKNELIASVLPIIIKECGKFAWHDQYNDLFAEACLKASEGIKTWDASAGSTFASWARTNAKQAIRDYLRDKSRLIRPSAENTNNGLIMALADFEAKNGELPQVGELVVTRSGREVVVTKDSLDDFVINKGRSSRLDAPIGDGKSTIAETIGGGFAVNDGDVKNKCDIEIAKLPELQQNIVRQVMDGEKYREIGDALGITPQRVEQIYKSALKKLQNSEALQELAEV